jgi:hypothetical protein
MRRQGLLLVPLAAMLMAWGWSATPPEYLRDPSKTHEDYPRADFICGIGSNKDDAAGAQTSAKADISRQISSRLQGEAKSVLRTSIKGRKVEASQDFAETVVERFASQEDLAPLMKPVYTWAPKGKYKQHMSYMCMSRAEGGEAILARVAPTQQKLRKAAELAGRANTAHSVSGYAVAYATARAAAAELFNDWVQLRVVSADKAEELEVELSKLDRLRSTAAEWRHNQQISVVVDREAGDQGAMVRGKFQQELQGLDVGASGSGKSCKDPDGSSHVLTIKPGFRCKNSSIGYIFCQLDFKLRIEHCASGEVGAGRVESEAFKGQHNHGDKEVAQDRAWQKVTSEGLVPGLKKIVGTQLPLD